MDTFLREHVPRAASDGTWPTTAKQRDSTGRIGIVKPAALSRHLRRYRSQAQSLARDHVLVEVTTTDGDGVTISILLALRADQRVGFLVDAAYIDELFQE